MKIMVESLYGDALVCIYNKQGDLIHTEPFSGKTDTQYIRSIPVAVCEYGHSKALFEGTFKYKVVE